MSIEKYQRLIDAARRLSMTPPVDDDFPEVKHDLDRAIYAFKNLSGSLTFKDFSHANISRCESSDGFDHTLESWSASDWVTAVTGELGEAANIVKKLNRVRDGIPGNKEAKDELLAMLADEIADTFIYLDLLARRYGFFMDEVVVSKFNRTSEKIGYKEKL